MSGKQKTWRNLIPVSGLEPGDVTPAVFEGRTIAVYDLGGGAVTASDARCTHAGANLCDGYFDGRRIECPLHQGLFNARTGAALGAPAAAPLRMIECRVQDGMVQILV